MAEDRRQMGDNEGACELGPHPQPLSTGGEGSLRRCRSLPRTYTGFFTCDMLVGAEFNAGDLAMNKMLFGNNNALAVQTIYQVFV